MSHKISLAVQTVQLLFNASTTCQWPRKLGNNQGEEEKYNLEWTDRQRADMAIRISKFRGAIREKYAIKIGNDWVVGQDKNWRPKEGADGRFEMIDRYELIDLDLEGEAYKALYPLCLWLSHPASPSFQPIGRLEECVYPLVEELGEWGQLEYDLGLREDEPSKLGSNGKG